MHRDIFQYKSPVGDIYCAFDGPFLVEVAIGKEEFTGIPVRASLSRAARSLFGGFDAYFEGKAKAFRQEFRLSGGTPFEQKIWLALREIPFGETRTYKWMAGKAGRPKAVRAAGGALGKNPLPIVLPCHRVIGSDGRLHGFSSGIEIKRWLLDHEQNKR